MSNNKNITILRQIKEEIKVAKIRISIFTEKQLQVYSVLRADLSLVHNLYEGEKRAQNQVARL